MPDITITDIPNELLRMLKARAAANNRSINSEIIACLKDSVSSARPSAEYIIKQAQRARASARGSLTIEEIRRAIEEGRE